MIIRDTDPDYPHARCFTVDGVPGYDAPLRCTLDYVERTVFSRMHAGMALDHHVAPLMRAAPDMLQALEDAVAAWDDNFTADTSIDGGDFLEWFAEWRQTAKAAIAKTKGRGS